MDGLTLTRANFKALDQQKEEELRSGLLFWMTHGDQGVEAEEQRLRKEDEPKK